MWEELTVNFSHTFSFMNENAFIHTALQDNCDKVFKIVSAELPTESQQTPTMRLMMTCYNVLGETNDEDDPRPIDIPESEGSCDIEAP